MKHVMPETKKANSSILQTLTGAKNIKARRRMEIGIPAVWNRGHYKTASAVGFATQCNTVCRSAHACRW
jgi:hypothetical protein